MIKRAFASLFLIIIAFSTVFALSACEKENPYIADEFFAMDTFVTVIADGSTASAEEAICEIEAVFSKTKPDSDISIINENMTTEVSPTCADVLEKAQKVAFATNGAFNPCMGQVVSLWDVTGKKYVPTSDEISALLPFCGFGGYTVSGNTVSKANKKTQIDLGACVKGYAAEFAVKRLKECGVSSAMVSIGGNIAVIGSAEARDGVWRVGIKNPFYPDEIAGYIDCTDKIISVSGDYERYFERDGEIYHHIFDSATGYPAKNGIKSVAVISDDGLESDALSTALFCMGVEKALEFYASGSYSFEAVIFSDNGEVYLTDGIKSDFVLYDDARYGDDEYLLVVN